MPNLVRYSNQLANSLWNATAVSVADLGTAAGSPTGRTTRVVYSATSGNWVLVENLIPEYQPNTQFTAAVWVKQETMPSGAISLNLYDGAANGVTQNVDFTTFSVTAPIAFGSTPVWSNFAGGVNGLTGGWHQIWVQGTTPSTPNQTLSVAIQGLGVPVGSSFLCGGFTLYQGTDLTFVETTTAPLGTQFLPAFPPLWHTTETHYPENSVAVKFGLGYTFASPPRGPPQRTFNIEFAALRWYQNVDGSVDITTSPTFNMGSLDNFYQAVQLYQPFTYPHPEYGNVICRFAKPLVIPKPLPGGYGVVKNVQIELIEVPT